MIKLIIGLVFIGLLLLAGCETIQQTQSAEQVPIKEINPVCPTGQNCTFSRCEGNDSTCQVQ